MNNSNFRALLLAGCAAAVVATATSAAAQSRDAVAFDIPSQPLGSALRQFAEQGQIEILFSSNLAEDRNAPALRGEMQPADGLALLLAQSGLTYRRAATGSFVIEAAQAPQSGSAAGDGADGTVEALIVTAQKREEDIQDVPIAISAFTQEQLENSQVAGGPDLMTQVPNFTFTKTNFTSYSIQIRGIGTQAISATTDPAVAIAFNNTPFIRNRFFEQEFFDLQRVEVLRGPQGTLYGRNATAGVVNIISQKPKFNFEAKASGDVSNYSSTRVEGMINLPLVEDKVALRLAGAWTKRDGYSVNEITGNPIDGRDLWSTRVSLRFAPTDRLDANLIWEHFEEDDDRLRSGKQLCKKHIVTQLVVPGENGEPDRVVDVDYFDPVPDRGQASGQVSNVQSVFSQGCLPNSLYDDASFQTPNGMSIPYYYQVQQIGLPGSLDDPYLSETQSHDLRSIESTVDPSYRAKTDVFELQVSYDLTDTLSLTSETAWSSDFIFSTQDFNRFNTAPGAFVAYDNFGNPTAARRANILDDNGVFCDPQIGCADRLVAVDLSTATSQHFSQELRLSSNFDGPFNFSLGGNFLRYDTEDKYYVFINTLTLVAALRGSGRLWEPGVSTNGHCLTNGPVAPDLNDVHGLDCIYIDPNPIDNLNDEGHNYFLSRNPYKLISYAVFGEAYYNITENLKVTAGLRWTVDKKEAPRRPSWILAGQTAGHPVQDVTEQEWREPTGRLTIDWKPDFAFTDETLLYGSYAHGYKAGGANPPPFGVVMFCPECQLDNFVEEYLEHSATHPRRFDPEFIDAFEVGSKNTLLDGQVTLNLAAFYYDYKGYQISQIVDRSAINQNFDATVWGLEIEADWRPLENLKLGFKGGYENTRVADGMRAVDIMDRTAGTPGWSVVRPFPTFPSNCILPTELYLPIGGTITGRPIWGLGGPNGGNPGGCEWAYIMGTDPGTELPYQLPIPPGAGAAGFWRTDPVTGATLYPGFDPDTAPNFGQGFFKELGGNELPNAPNFTATITADYTIPLPNDWLATLHTDLYYQSEAWTRIFNTEGYDKLKAYTNVNLAAIFTNEERGWKVMAYIKNVMDRDSITGAFLNSDDTGLTTNVFLTEPRLYGLRVTKEWTGGSWFDGFNARRQGPFPLTVELGGQVQRHEAPYEKVFADFTADTPKVIDIFGDAQNRDLDWGDGREVKVSWRPNAGPWKVSAGLRYGRTNNDTTRLHAMAQTEPGCAFGGKYAFLAPLACDPISDLYSPDNLHAATIWAADTARDREEHELIDFAVSRDVGLGSLSRSALGVGLRSAHFESDTNVTMDGVIDRVIQAGWFRPVSNPDCTQPGPRNCFDHYVSSLHADREFEGVGPILSWEAAVPLLGGDEAGRLELDWSVTGGVLFGKQDTAVGGEQQTTANVLLGALYGIIAGVPEAPIPVTIAPRSEDVTVTTFGASLGLAYTVDRISIGAGYRWERYSDVLDIGFDEAKDADRTIDGPYFKLSVGVGG